MIQPFTVPVFSHLVLSSAVKEQLNCSFLVSHEFPFEAFYGPVRSHTLICCASFFFLSFAQEHTLSLLVSPPPLPLFSNGHTLCTIVLCGFLVRMISNVLRAHSYTLLCSLIRKRRWF